MSNLALWAIIGAWVFQAGVTYAGFLILKGQMLEALLWQKDHGKADDSRFMLIVGMFATYVPDDRRHEIMDLIREFAKQ